MKKNLLVYPFTKEMSPLARFRHQLADYELTAALPTQGYGWEGKDACSLDGGAPTGVTLGSSFSDELERCDAVLIDGHPEHEAAAREAGKEIVACPPAPGLETDMPMSQDIPLKEIPIPVVMVMGLGENCQKFDIQLGLREAFQREGYKVSQFGSKPYSGLFGFEPLPAAPDISAWKKSYLYNQLFYETYLREKPDVMIIGVPGGIMQIGSFENGLFGETAFVLATAAKPDIALLSFYFVEPTPEYFHIHRQFARFRLGIHNVDFHTSNTKWIEDRNLHKVDYLTLESRFVLDTHAPLAFDPLTPLFNALMPESGEQAYGRVIEKLQQNVHIM